MRKHAIEAATGRRRRRWKPTVIDDITSGCLTVHVHLPLDGTQSPRLQAARLSFVSTVGCLEHARDCAASTFLPLSSPRGSAARSLAFVPFFSTSLIGARGHRQRMSKVHKKGNIYARGCGLRCFCRYCGKCLFKVNSNGNFLNRQGVTK